MPITIPISTGTTKRDVYNLYQWMSHLNERVNQLEKEIEELKKNKRR